MGGDRTVGTREPGRTTSVSTDANSFEGSDGTRSIARFVETPSGLIFTTLSMPQVAPSTGILVCPPIHADFSTNYRKEVLLARALAARGFAVQRFHYRGLGNSDGEASEMTFDGMVDDAAAAAVALRDAAEVSRVACFGTRFGALVAAAAAREVGASHLAFWEPAIEAASLFREATRAVLAHRLQQDGAEGASFEQLVEELRTQGVVDILGYSLDQRLFESSIDRTLEDELGASPRPVLFVQIGSSLNLRRPLRELVERLRAKAWNVDVRSVKGGEPWWVTSRAWVPVEFRPTTEELLGATAEWFERELV